jgi:hypothetical protein
MRSALRGVNYLFGRPFANAGRNLAAHECLLPSGAGKAELANAVIVRVALVVVRLYGDPVVLAPPIHLFASRSCRQKFRFDCGNSDKASVSFRCDDRSLRISRYRSCNSCSSAHPISSARVAPGGDGEMQRSAPDGKNAGRVALRAFLLSSTLLRISQSGACIRSECGNNRDILARRSSRISACIYAIVRQCQLGGHVLREKTLRCANQLAHTFAMIQA